MQSPESTDTAPATPRLLEGVRVLELARILAGPWAGQLLADLGADVVKVERPGVGDDTRAWGPPFMPADGGGDLSATYFHSANRGKRSIAADIDTPDGQALVRRLAAHADVVIENFKVGGLARYGLDHASLLAVNPRLVTCSITGFGQTGPYAARAGYDFVVQGMGGFMYLTGDPAGEPQKAGVATADLFTGLYAATAILAALRRRDATGQGAHLDLSLLDVQTAMLSNQAVAYLATGINPPRMGNAHTTIVPYQVFPVADGHIVVAAGNDGQFARFAHALGAPELASDERFRTNPGRVTHRAVLVPLLSALTRRHPAAPLLDELAALGVPSGPIHDIAEVFADPQVVSRGLAVRVPAPRAAGGSVPAIRAPLLVDGCPVIAARASPSLDADRNGVLADAAWGALSK